MIFERRLHTAAARPTGRTRRPGPGRGIHLRLTALGGVLILSVALLSSGAQAASVNELRSKVADLEQQAQFLSIRYQPQAASKDQLAEHRLVDAQVLYTLKDYTRAAILLLDYVAKYKETRGYPEALFFLADSLYHKRDYLSARRYFKIIVDKIRGRYYQDALQRLVELSLRTGDYSEVDQYLDALTTIPQVELKPSVPYVKGKYYYFRKRYDDALATFRSIPSGHKYHMHALYFTGAALVQKDDLTGAAQVFESLLRVQPTTASDTHIRDLAYLAVGRLLYEQGKIDPAIDMYQKVDRKSPEFDTSLYEIAWAYIKATKNEKALRALDLLVLAHPESPFVPQVRVLQGNLLIRLEKWGRATDLFAKTREKFVPVHDRMQQIMQEHADPNVFFDVLLTKNLDELTVTIQVPKLAVHWVREIPNVKRALSLVQDVRDIQDSLAEAQQLIVRLEHAINSPAKIKIFPEFAAAKASALEVENRLVRVRNEILASEAELVRGIASASEKKQLEDLMGRRRNLEQRIDALPTTADGYADRSDTQLARLDGLAKQLSELSVVVQSLQAQLVAAQKFFADTASAKKPEIQASFRTESEGMRAMVVGLQADIEELRQAIGDARSSVGVGGADEVAERSAKERFTDALTEEHRALQAIGARLGGEKAERLRALAGLYDRTDKIQGRLSSFDSRLDEGVEGKLTSIRAALGEEKEFVGRYQGEVADYKARTDTVAGGITYAGFQSVAQDFYEIVVRADVGIIDVAWALKDAKSKEVSRLVRQQKMDLKVLDSEFKEVLRED